MPRRYTKAPYRRRTTRRRPVFHKKRAPMKRIKTSKMKDTYQSDRLRCRLVYAGETAEVKLSGGVVVNESFAMNGLFDPFLGTGGGQPSGYDNMFTQYDKCLVHGARIDVDVINSNSATDYEWEVCLTPYAAGALVATTMETAREQPYSLWQQRGGARSGRPQAHLSQYMSIAKIQGESNIHQDKYYQPYGANPATRPIWTLKFDAIQSAAEPGTVTLEVAVKITYYCEFIERLNTPPALVDTIIREAKASGHWEELLRKQGLAKQGEEEEPTDFLEVEPTPPPAKKKPATAAPPPPIIPPGMRLVKA